MADGAALRVLEIVGTMRDKAPTLSEVPADAEPEDLLVAYADLAMAYHEERKQMIAALEVIAKALVALEMKTA